MAFGAVPLWLATKHKYPAGQACGILESRRLARRIVRASRLVKELATKLIHQPDKLVGVSIPNFGQSI